MIKKIVNIGLLLSLFFSSPVLANVWCDIEKEYAQFEYTPSSPYIKVNPFGNAPLTAIVKFSLPQKASVSLQLKGKDGAPDLTRTFSSMKTEWEIPVYGLYPNTENQIILTINYPDTSETYPIKIKTGKIDMNNIWSIPIKNQKGKGFLYFASGGKNGGNAFVFDEYGHIRYVFKNKQDAMYKQTQLLHNYLVTDDKSGKVIVHSLLGEKITEFKIPDNFISYQHGIYEGPQKTILLIGTFPETYALIENQKVITGYDQIIAIDLETGKISKRWNLATILNPDRALYFRLSPKTQPVDWAHANSIQYIPEENALLISAKHIGFFKIDYDSGKLKWIATPHILLHKSGADGKGPSLNHLALTAVNENNAPYPDDVQKGKKIMDSFHWPMMNHDVKQISPEVISIFSNNGPLYRPDLASLSTSDVLLFSVDEKQKTISLKKKISLSEYADIASGVTYLPKDNNLMIFSANLPDKNTKYVYNKIYRYSLDLNAFLSEIVVPFKNYFYRIEPIFFKKLEEPHPSKRQPCLVTQQ